MNKSRYYILIAVVLLLLARGGCGDPCVMNCEGKVDDQSCLESCHRRQTEWLESQPTVTPDFILRGMDCAACKGLCQFSLDVEGYNTCVANCRSARHCR